MSEYNLLEERRAERKTLIGAYISIYRDEKGKVSDIDIEMGGYKDHVSEDALKSVAFTLLNIIEGGKFNAELSGNGTTVWLHRMFK